MAVNSYSYLTTVRITGTWEQNDVAIDPDTVTFRFISPDEVTTSKVYLTDSEVVRDSTGIYRYDLTLNEEGIWYYRWEGVGSGVQSSFDGVVECSPSSFV